MSYDVTLIRAMGFRPTDDELKSLLEEVLDNHFKCDK